MAKTWKKYEILILIDESLGQEATEAMIERARNIVRTNSGKVLKTERWGIRDMAFEIKHHAKSYYVLIEFAGEGPVSTELSRQLNLIDSIIKFQTVKLDENLDPDELPDTEEVIDTFSKPAGEAETAGSDKDGVDDGDDGGDDGDDGDDEGDDNEDDDNEDDD